MTAKEFLKQLDKEEGNIDKLYYPEYVQKVMIRFARHHVEQALEQASKKADTDGRHTYLSGREYAPVKVNKNSILNSYPLTLIK
jgi:hypothetical protein